MTTITIASLSTTGTVADTAFIPSENLGITQNFTALSLKNYMTTLPNLTVTGTLVGTISAASASQPNIATLGTLTGLTTTGQIVSTIATGTPPLNVQSTSLVANLYVARAAIADSASGGVTTSTNFASTGGSDIVISGNVGNISATLNSVNTNAGTWGGNVGSTYYIPQFAVNSKGLVTSASNIAVNLNLASQAVTNLTGTANQITATATVGAVELSLPSQINITNLTATSNIAGGTVYDNAHRVLTQLTVSAGTGLSGGGVVNGPTGTLVINNAGVLSLSAGLGISVSASTGAITVTNTGVTGVTGASGISTSASTGGVTITPASGYNGYGVRTISSGTPSGGSDGDIWYVI